MQIKYLTPMEVEAMYGVPVGTLAQWRVKGIGPDYFKLGEAVRYSVADMDAFFEARRVKCHRKGER